MARKSSVFVDAARVKCGSAQDVVLDAVHARCDKRSKRHVEWVIDYQARGPSANVDINCNDYSMLEKKKKKKKKKA